MAIFTFNNRLVYNSNKDIAKANNYSDADEGVDFLKNKMREVRDLSYGDVAGVDDFIDEKIDTWVKDLEDDKKAYIDELSFEIKNLESKKGELKKKICKALEVISYEFNATSGEDWSTFFYNEADYDLFSQLLANYFAGGAFKDKYSIIIVKNRVKGKLIIVLKSIHLKMSHYDVLKDDTGFLDIVKLLSAYKDKSYEQLIADFGR